MRACRFSSVRSASWPANSLCERALVRRHHRLDRELVRIGAERRAERTRILLGRRRGIRRGHDRRAHTRGAERSRRRGRRRAPSRCRRTARARRARSRSSRRSRAARAPARRRPPPRPARAARLSESRPDRRRAPRRRAGSAGRTATSLGDRLAAGRWPGSRSRAAAGASRSTSQTSSSAPNCAARAIVLPVWSITHECPSKTSSSCPPTSPQKATQARLSRARWANMRSRSAPLPRWYGEAEMLISRLAPASASSLAGGPGSHMSSQTVSPMRVPARSITAPPLPAWK